jgi:outer membrane receptor protein involved in Fe transport
MISARTLRTSLRLPAVGCWALVGLVLTHPGRGQEMADDPGEIDFDALAEISSDRTRAAGDGRPPIDDYARLDLTLRRQIRGHWDLALGVRNLLDDDAREPGGREIPYDYPQVQRSFYVELRHHDR